MFYKSVDELTDDNKNVIEVIEKTKNIKNVSPPIKKNPVKPIKEKPIKKKTEIPRKKVSKPPKFNRNKNLPPKNKLPNPPVEKKEGGMFKQFKNKLTGKNDK